jgi:hypothetical protein
MLAAVSVKLGRVSHGVPVWLRGLSTAEVAQGPSGIAEHAQLTAVAQEGQQRLESAACKNVVAARRAVTSNVTKGPDSLLPDIGLVAAEQLNEDRDSSGLDNDLCLLRGTGRNVCEGPRSLELDERVGRSQKLDETANNASLNNLFDRWVALLGEKLSEFGGSLDLEVDLLGEDTFDHLREVLVQLVGIACQHESSYAFRRRVLATIPVISPSPAHLKDRRLRGIVMAVNDKRKKLFARQCPTKESK